MCKLDDLTFRNDELVAMLDTYGRVQTCSVNLTAAELGSSHGDGASLQARLDMCEQQCETLNCVKCALVKELEQCKKELEQCKKELGVVDEQLRSSESEKSHLERDLEECLSSKAQLCGALDKTAAGGCLRKERQEPDVDREQEGQDTHQTDAESVHEAQLKTSLIERESQDSVDSETTQCSVTATHLQPPEGAGYLAGEVGRLTNEVENWRQLNSDLSGVCESLDKRVVDLSAKVEQLSVVNRDLRAENAALVFEREDWTSGSEDVPDTQETGSGYPHGWDAKEDKEEEIKVLGEAELRLHQYVMGQAASADSSQLKVVNECGDSSCDKRVVLPAGQTLTTDGEMSLECQLKDDHVKCLETRLHRQQCDIQRAALEYKLVISLLSQVMSQQQHQGPDGDPSDTHRQCDMSVSTCLMDRFTLSSTESPEDMGSKKEAFEMSCSVELREKTDRLEAEVSQLTADNVSLSEQCEEQERIISQLRHQVCITTDSLSRDDSLSTGDSLSSDVAEKQIALLQKQSDELHYQVAALKEQLWKLAPVMCQRSTLARKLSTEQRCCERLVEQKEQLEQELLQERVALGRHIHKQHRLEQLLCQRAAPCTGGNIGEAVNMGRKEREADWVYKPHHEGRDVGRRCPSMGAGCGKVRLRCGCSVEVGGRKMHARCEYHRAIERLRAALAHTDARRHQQVAPLILPTGGAIGHVTCLRM